MVYHISLVQINELVGRNIRLPYSLGVLWQQAMTSDYNQQTWHLDHIVYKRLDIQELAVALSQSNVVCFSCYVWNFVYQIELAKAIKKLNANCFVVVGGPHIHTDHPNFWKNYQDCIDMAIVGEGDNSFKLLLEQFPSCDVETIPGAWTPTYFKDIAPRVTDLESLPSPYLEGFFDNIIDYEKSQGKLIEAMMQTNRGCPYHCSFCEQGKEYKNKLYFFSKDRVLKELEWMGQKEIEILDIADDNWGIHERDVEFMEKLCAVKTQYGYPRVFDATYAKNATERVLEMAELDYSAKTNLIRGITFAYQSNHLPTLKAVKRFNLIPEKQIVLIKELKKLGTPTYTEMIWPLPHETYKSLLSGIDATIAIGLDDWLEINLLRLPTVTDLHTEFKDNYKFGTGNDPAYLRPVSNDWLSYETIIHGMVFYTWLSVLFYFGFGRPLINHFQNSICDTVDKFVTFSQNHKWLNKMTKLIAEFWEARTAGSQEPKLGIFKEETSLWLPFIHLASWLQKDYDQFNKALLEFALSLGIEKTLAQRLTDECKTSTIKFEDSQFNSLYDFVEYYYAYNRKKGLAYKESKYAQTLNQSRSR